MGKGKDKDLSTDWSDYTWDEHGYWYSIRKSPLGEYQYHYRYPDPPQDAQEDKQIPRSPGPNIISSSETSENYHLISTSSNEFYKHGNSGLDIDTHYSHSIGTAGPSTAALLFDETSTSQETGIVPDATPTFTLSPSLTVTAAASDTIDARYHHGSLSPSPPGEVTSTNLAYKILAPSFENDDNTSSSIVEDFQCISIGPTLEQGLSSPSSSEWGPRQLRQPKRILAALDNEIYEILDPRYRRVPENKQKSFWKVGRVFMMLWTEIARTTPPRNGGETRNGTHFSWTWLREGAYSEIRRFVVMQVRYGCNLCSPIQTYGGQATLKPNLPETSQHTIIYTGDKAPDEKSYQAKDGSVVKENLSKDPIRVLREQDDEEGALDDASRLNYSKVYTVENYVRVLNIGMVHKNSMASLERNSFLQITDPPQPPQRRPPPRSNHGGGHSKMSSRGGSHSHKSRNNTKESRHQGSKKK